MAESLIDGLKAELYLTPKPGLVDLRNNGSHPDLSLLLMARSIVLLRQYLRELCAALAAPSGSGDPVLIGQRAERRMLQERGTNCHRGGIFLTGLLLMAAARCDLRNPVALQAAVKMTAGEFFARRPQPPCSHGETVRKQHPQAGIVAEALGGLPGVFDIVLPALDQGGLHNGRGFYLALAELMLRVDDSTARHRCGDSGIAYLQQSGLQLRRCLVAGHDPVPLLRQMDAAFRQRNLTMGGVADLLGVGLGYAAYLRHST